MPRTLTVEKLKDFIDDLREQFEHSQIPLVASSLAYTTILSLIPLLAMSFAIFKAFDGLDTFYEKLEPFILSNLAEGSGAQVTQALQTFIENAHAKALGIGGFIGLVVTSMSMLFKVERTFHHIWQAPLSRTFFQRFSAYWLFITVGPVGFAYAIGYATSLEIPMSSLLPGASNTLFRFVLSVGIFFTMYKWIPTCKVRWRPALAAAVVGALGWDIMREGYALYTHRVLTYNKIYGSLGAIPLFLIWIYLVWVIVLGGAALSALFQRRMYPHLKIHQR